MIPNKKLTSLEERYLILDDLLKQNHYGTVEKECTINLTDKGTSTQEWEIIRTHSLENDLVGGLMTYLSDSDLMTPGENTDCLFRYPQNYGCGSDGKLSWP